MCPSSLLRPPADSITSRSFVFLIPGGNDVNMLVQSSSIALHSSHVLCHIDKWIIQATAAESNINDALEHKSGCEEVWLLRMGRWEIGGEYEPSEEFGCEYGVMGASASWV